MRIRYTYSAWLRCRPVRLWRIPARRTLRMQRLGLLRWTALMAATALRPGESQARSLTAQMAPFLGLQQGERELFEDMLAQMTTEGIIEDSSFHCWVLEAGERLGARFAWRLARNRRRDEG